MRVALTTLFALSGLALSGLALPGVARADDAVAAPEAARGTVADIEITGLRRVEEAAIRAAIQTRVGESLTPYMVSRDIKGVYATGFVDDVVVDVSPRGDGVVVTFQVDEKPAVREVRITGNKKIDEDSLREAIDISSFAVLNELDVAQNVERLRDKYVEKGYYLVQVEPKIQDVGNDQVDLTFDITENRKVIVQTIDITGNDNIPDRKVRKYLQTKQAGILPWLTNSGTFNEDNLENDVQIVKTVFLEEGYVDVKVDEPRVFLSPDKRSIYLSIHVEEGPQYQIGAVRIEGDFVEEEGLTTGAARQIVNGDTARTVNGRWQRALARGRDGQPDPGWDDPDVGDGFLVFNEKHPALVTGETFKLSAMQLTMQEISDLYGDQGYAFANVIPMPDTDPEARVVDIVFDIQRGEKVKIGRIEITGNDPTYDKVVRREIPINEGEIYRGSALKEARQRLDRLGYFEEAKISTPRGTEPDVLDMNVEVTEQPTGSFSVGAGFSNLDNFMFTANVAKNNFLGLGYIMRAEANISSRRQQWDLYFYDPFFLDTRWTLRARLFSYARQYIEDEYGRGGSLAIGRYLDQRDDIRLEFDYTFKDTGITSVEPYKQHLLGGQLYRNGFTSTGGLTLEIDKRNNRINATRGVYASASSELSGGFRLDEDTMFAGFGGDFNFWEAKANVRTYYPVSPGGEWLIFKYNGTLGFIGSTDGSVVPYIHRYRAGGIISVRGYDWYTLGPSIRASGYRADNSSSFGGSDDPTAPDDRLVVGGNQTWINNFELEAPIIPQAGISTVIFFDAGNAFGDPWGGSNINPLDLRFSYGFGVRWFSPMGPLRFEWGFPINPRDDERKSVFDFYIGSMF